jgi:DNA polymerase I-like protein with 3'-5' exonuclease and polymerase domains
MASVANDKAMIEELTNGSKDLHSLTAKMVFKEIPRDLPVKEIKSKYHDLRQKAKGYEFAFNYAGNDKTIMKNFGLNAKEAKEIYDSYMKGFNGLRDYQAFRKLD